MESNRLTCGGPKPMDSGVQRYNPTVGTSSEYRNSY